MENLERYNRQMILPEFGREKQQLLLNAKVLMIGAGGLSCPAMLYLAAAGVGQIGIIDFDKVEVSNLHRQILYNEDDIGKPKAEVAAQKIEEYNKDVRIEVFDTRLSTENALEIMADYDLVVDGSDNFPTRYLVNDACVLLDIPFVHASIYRFEGQIAVFNRHENDKLTANYRDLFPEPPGEDEVPNCAEAGVIGVLPGIMGSLQANEAIKILSKLGQPLSNRLLTFNALTNSFFEFKITPSLQSQQHAPKTEAEFRKMNYLHFCNSEQEAVDEILPEDFDQRCIENGLCIVDVRNENELPKLKNQNAITIPLPELSSRLEELDATEELVFVCQTGVRSKKAASMAKKAYPQKQVFSLKGGVAALINNKRSRKNLL